MRAILLLFFVSFLGTSLIGQETLNIATQEYSTRTAHLQIKSNNNVSEIVADNYQVYSDINFQEKTISFVGLMSAWEFELGAIDRAFNSDRINLSDYPKFTYDGTIDESSNVDLNTPGRYELNVSGNLYIGSYKRVTPATGYCYVKADGSIDLESDFSFMIEPETLEVINKLMKERLPGIIPVDTETLGISRLIEVNLYLTYQMQ